MGQTKRQVANMAYLIGVSDGMESAGRTFTNMTMVIADSKSVERLRAHRKALLAETIKRDKDVMARLHNAEARWSALYKEKLDAERESVLLFAYICAQHGEKCKRKTHISFEWEWTLKDIRTHVGNQNIGMVGEPQHTLVLATVVV